MKISRIVAVVILMVLAAACSSERRIIVVLFDVSASCFDPRAENPYPKVLAAIFSRLRPGDIVRIGFIDGNPSAAGSLYEFAIPPATWMDNDLRVRYQFQQTLAREYRSVTANLRNQPGSKTTSILDAVAIASSVMNANPEAVQRRLLILVSDGVEDSAKANFEPLPPNANAIERLIRAERDRGLPTLTSVEWILWHPMRVRVSDQVLRASAAFWAAYAKATGGTLLASGSNALDVLKDTRLLDRVSLSEDPKEIAVRLQ